MEIRTIEDKKVKILNKIIEKFEQNGYRVIRSKINTPCTTRLINEYKVYIKDLKPIIFKKPVIIFEYGTYRCFSIFITNANKNNYINILEICKILNNIDDDFTIDIKKDF